MKKGLIVAGLLAVAAPAFAEQTAEVFEARITEQQSFDYTTATAMNPVYAQAETLDGQCKFTISVVGMQGGVGPGGGGGK